MALLAVAILNILASSYTMGQQTEVGRSSSNGPVQPIGPQGASYAVQRIFPREALVTPSSAGPETIISRPQAASTDYVLNYNDLISIKVYQEPDLDSTVRVAKDGSVNFPLLGSIQIGGKNLQQATRYIREMLAQDYLVNPQLNLTIVEYSKRQFTVLGEIQRPGSYLMPDDKPLTLQQAIALAGGYTPGAKKGKVTVTRFDGDRKLIQDVDASAFSKDRDAKPFMVLPDDHITVHERFF